MSGWTRLLTLVETGAEDVGGSLFCAMGC